MQRPAVIANWHALVARRDIDALDDLLAEDVVFYSPVVHKPQIGKIITRKYLAAAMQVLNNDAFRYRNEWFGETSAVLEFETTIGNISINGVDIITWNKAGKITEFKVLVRPLKAINLLHQSMASMLERIGGS